MPIEDRNYYRDEGYSYTDSFSRGSSGLGAGKKSIVIILIIVNVAIFAIDAFTSDISQDPAAGKWLSWTMSLKTQASTDQSELPAWQLFPLNFWQIFTYGFAHASISSKSGIFHILFNMVGLFFLGRPVEQKYGSSEFLKFYIAALLFAGVVSLAYNMLRDQSTYLVGASGAVAAVAILFILTFRKETLLFFGVLPMPAWVAGALIIGIDILNAFNAESRIGWYAHLAGAAFAAVYFRFRWNFRWIKDDWFTRVFSSKPNLKIHKESVRQEELKAQADEILEKVHREGEASLSKKERKILQKYSRQVRQDRH